jgi:hypothetical protein
MSTLLLQRPTAEPVLADVLLLHAFARRRRSLGLGDLARAMSGTGARLSDVVAGLAAEVEAGRLTPRGFRLGGDGRPEGPLLYDLTELGWAAVEADRMAA